MLKFQSTEFRPQLLTTKSSITWLVFYGQQQVVRIFFYRKTNKNNSERVTVKREQAVYTFNAMMADIGGSLGLILGLSVVKILQLLINLCRR